MAVEDILDQDIDVNELGRSIPKHEKKARKAFAKLGLTPVKDVYRVVVRKQKQTVFVVSSPDVFKAPNADVYVVFGEARVDDAQASLQQAAQDAFAKMNISDFASKNEEEEEEDEEGDVDETGLDADEIEAVMSSASCTRARAVKALRKNDNVVDAVLSLSNP